MRRYLLLLLLLPGTVLTAQTATSMSRFAIDQAAPDLATANGYQYLMYVDALPGVPVAFSCTGFASPYACTAPIPAFTPGTHTVSFTVSDVVGESVRSTLLTFTLVVVPTAPANPQIVK